MPFTPSHIAAALPFARTPLPMAPLVIGTMAPDVPYFLPIRVPRELTHSLRIPRADPLGRRAANRGWGSSIVLGVLAALIGILTHLAWDAFTHKSSTLVVAVPALHAQLGPLQVSSWLQHASTIGGLIAIAVWVSAWVHRTPRHGWSDRTAPGTIGSSARITAWAAIVVVFCAAGAVVWIRGMVLGVEPFDPNLVFRGATVAGGTARFVGLVICAIWWAVTMVRAARRT